MIRSASEPGILARRSTRSALVLAAVGLCSIGATAMADRLLSRRGGTTAAAPAAGALEVRLHRLATVGRRGHLVASGEKHTHMVLKVDNAEVKNESEDLIVRMDAVEEVTAIDAHGNPSTETYTITKFETGDAAHPTALVPAGSVITVVKGQGQAHGTITMGGVAVAAPVAAALSVVASTHQDRVSDDDVFGTNQRQNVGGTWAMHGDVAAADLQATAGIQSTLSGTASLVGHAPFQGIDSEEISGHMTGRLTGMAQLPPGATVRVGTLNINVHGMFPIDVSKPQLQSGIEMNLNLDVSFQAQGKAARMQMTMREKKEAAYTPM